LKKKRRPKRKPERVFFAFTLVHYWVNIAFTTFDTNVYRMKLKVRGNDIGYSANKFVVPP
jgi:hypothetical protein